MKAQVYFYDIEIYINLFMVTVKSKEGGVVEKFEIYSSCGKEKNDLKKIIKFFNDRKKWFCGFNNKHFDDPIIHYLIHERDKFRYLIPEEIAEDIYNFVQNTVTAQGVKNPYKYMQYFGSIDLMRILQVGFNRKALKLIAVNLKWHKIQDLPIPMNKRLSPDEIKEVASYNLNDVLVTENLYHHIIDKITLRASASTKFGVNLMQESDSGMANKILESYYAKISGLRSTTFTKWKTERNVVYLDRIISPKVKFKTKAMQTFLDEMKAKKLYGKKKELKRRVRIGNGFYEMGGGGLHSLHNPTIYEETENTVLEECDVSSYYPVWMIRGKIAPHHLDRRMFLKVLTHIVNHRLKAKKEGRKEEAETFKITANSVFGKLGFKGSWLFDIAAMYAVTINGQLFLLMLIEALELAGIKVIYANTDGLVSIVRKDQQKEYRKICAYWEKYLGLSLKFNQFKKMIIRDVNNYLVIKKDGKCKAKGALDKDRYKDVMKGFNMPIVTEAIHNYFVDGTPVEDTIRGHKDLLDFCIAKKVDESFSMVTIENVDGHVIETKLQKTNRYIVTEEGCILMKLRDGKYTNMLVGQKVRIVNDYDPDEEIDIDYDFYINECYRMIRLFEGAQMTLF